jgi:hypothetical protein
MSFASRSSVPQPVSPRKKPGIVLANYTGPSNLEKVQTARTLRKEADRAEQIECAIKIQAVARGKIGRATAKKKHEHGAALRIQQSVRMKLAAQAVEELREYKKETQHRRAISVRHVQRMERGRQGRRRTEAQKLHHVHGLVANNIRTAWRIYARCLAAKRDSAKLQAQLDTEKKQWDSYSKLQRQESAKLSRQLSVDLALAKEKEEDERAREAEHHRRKALTQVARR